MIFNVDIIYPIGSLYITTDTSFNPNIKFGGTWARLEGDVYLKNVPSTASSQPIGNYGGTSNQHKIPVTSIPSHNHRDFYQVTSGFGDGGGTYAGRPMVRGNVVSPTTAFWYTDNAGGGEAYYPYYYGIICWHRTA